MKTIKVWSNFEDKYVNYNVPSVKEAREYNDSTKDTDYDPIEKKDVTGGIPMLWERHTVFE